jgi:hypothetical protein
VAILLKSEANTYGLPEGEPIRRELVRWFRRQRAEIAAHLGLGKKTQMDPADMMGGEGEPPDPEYWRLGALAESERMTPLIEAMWDAAGAAFLAKIDLDPDAWRVTNPHIADMIRKASLEFCEATNATTSLQLEEAIAELRRSLAEGIVDRGESVRLLTDRVGAIFDTAETFRARRIAITEASRAVHSAQEVAAIESGVVVGWEWLLSDGACPLCYAISDDARFVRLGQSFARVGDHPTYSDIRHPPAHPGCRCTLLEVLSPDYGGPAEVNWTTSPLDQPGKQELAGAEA